MLHPVFRKVKLEERSNKTQALQIDKVYYLTKTLNLCYNLSMEIKNNDRRPIYNAIQRETGMKYTATKEEAEEAVRIICRNQQGELVVFYSPRSMFFRIDDKGEAHELALK